MKSPLNHVAIIMDGNGRWAQSRRRPRLWGHVRGASRVNPIVEKADELGIKALTLYAFSSENWSRPTHEIEVLFRLLKKFLKSERKNILKNNICFKVIGFAGKLPPETLKMIDDLEKETKLNTGLKLNFAFGYGGRDEITFAVNQFLEERPGTKITPELLGQYLWTHDCGDVDLLIRTGGDQRISNFLLWQSAYAELSFIKTAWPEFTPHEFEEIIDQIGQRERRFGAISARENLEQSQKEAYQHQEMF